MAPPPDDTSDQTADLSALDAQAKDTAKTFTQFGQTVTRVLDRIGPKLGRSDTQFKKFLGTIGQLPRRLKPGIQELEHLEETATKVASALDNATDSAVALAIKGKKSTSAYVATLKPMINNLNEAVKATKTWSTEMKNQGSELDRMVGSILDLTDKIGKLNDLEKKGGKLTEDQIKEREDLTKTLKMEEEGWQNLSFEVEQTAKEFQKSVEKMVDEFRNFEEGAKHIRSVNREARKMEGGIRALTVPLEALGDSKAMETLDKVFSGAMMLKGLMMINEGLQTSAQLYKVNAQLAERLGKTADRGIGGFSNAMDEADKSASAFALTAAELGIKMEEVSAIGDKIRIGIKIGNQGQLGEKAVRDLTKEVAAFSQVTGVDADVAVQMLDDRIKRMGFSAQEAQGDLMAMRVNLKQMTVGLKGNNIPMEDMVELINEASYNSQAFVVDTRIMTQAMRAAATQAENLGASQKLAKDTAKVMGQAMNTQADAIVVPAFMDLARQLMADPEQVMKGLTEQQKKEVKHTREQLAKGAITYHEAALMLKEQVGGTAVGIDAKLKRLEQVIGNSPEFSSVAKGLGFEGSATALEHMREQLQKAVPLAKELHLPVSEIMSATDMISGIGDDLKKAQGEQEKLNLLVNKYAMSPADAANYLKIQREWKGTAADLEKANINAIHAATDPLAKADRMVQSVLDRKKQGDSAGKITDDLANLYGIQSDEGRKVLFDAVNQMNEDNKGVLRDQLKGSLEIENKGASVQRKTLDDFWAKMSGGIPAMLEAVVDKITGGHLKGPKAKIVGGAAAIAGSLALLYAGRTFIVSMIADGVAQGNTGGSKLMKGLGENSKLMLDLARGNPAAQIPGILTKLPFGIGKVIFGAMRIFSPLIATLVAMAVGRAIGKFLGEKFGNFLFHTKDTKLAVGQRKKYSAMREKGLADVQKTGDKAKIEEYANDTNVFLKKVDKMIEGGHESTANVMLNAQLPESDRQTEPDDFEVPDYLSKKEDKLFNDMFNDQKQNKTGGFNGLPDTNGLYNNQMQNQQQLMTPPPPPSTQQQDTGKPRLSASARGAPSAEMDPNSIGPDGSVTVRFRNFGTSTAQIVKMMKTTV